MDRRAEAKKFQEGPASKLCRECGLRSGNRAIGIDGVCSSCLKIISMQRNQTGERWRSWPLGMKKADHWLIVGSSPSMPFFLEYLVKDRGWDLNSPDLIVATANAALYELIRYGCYSDYYAVMEICSPKLYGRMYEDARENHGTKIVTSSMAMNNKIGIDADIILEITGFSDVAEFKRGRYITGGTSGSHLMQLAVNLGAKQVTLIGMEGYRSTPHTKVVDTFDGRLGPSFGAKHTEQWYGPLMQQVVSACPDVLFDFYGRLRYPMVGHNVFRCDDVLVEEGRKQRAEKKARA